MVANVDPKGSESPWQRPGPLIYGPGTFQEVSYFCIPTCLS